MHGSIKPSEEIQFNRKKEENVKCKYHLSSNGMYQLALDIFPPILFVAKHLISLIIVMLTINVSSFCNQAFCCLNPTDCEAFFKSDIVKKHLG
jgi:hypothetical protein